MYIPDEFKNTDFEKQVEFVRQHTFAVLVTTGKQSPIATHIPVLSHVKNNKLILYGHIAKPNPQAETFYNDADALVIFQGSNAYVSSSWYSHENVSTWNYQAVHCYGKIKVQTELELMECLQLMTDFYEAKVQHPKTFDKIPAQVIRENFGGIVGFEIEVSRIDAIDKLSQNRDNKDYFEIVKQLSLSEDKNAQQIAAEMQKRRNGNEN